MEFGRLFTKKQRGRKLQFIAMGSDFNLAFCVKHCVPSKTHCYVVFDENNEPTYFSVIG